MALSSSLSLTPSLSSSSTTTSTSSFIPRRYKLIIQQQIALPLRLSCQYGEERGSSSSTTTTKSVVMSKRSFGLSLCSAFVLPMAAEAAVLEAEDDLELLEKVKQDRKKRLQRQGFISSSKQETGYLQDLVFKLSEVGQAIENNDLNTASSVLGKNTETDWIKKANTAFSKLSSSPEEKAEVEMFNKSISLLISSVIDKDIDSSKIAFVASASAFEKWTSLTGIDDKLKGL